VPIDPAARPFANGRCATFVDKPLKTPARGVGAPEVAPLEIRRAGPVHRVLPVLMVASAAVVLAASAALASAVVVLHLGVRPVLTGSMSPAFGPGAILITRPVPVRDLRSGMIPLFVPPGGHAELAHRITSVSGSPDGPTVTTKGDANKTADPWHARFKADSVPVVVATVPWLGRLMAGIRGPIQLTLIILGGLVVAISGARWILGAPPPAPSVQARAIPVP